MMPDRTAQILAELTTKWLGMHPEHRDTVRLVGELLVELARSESTATTQAPTTPASVVTPPAPAPTPAVTPALVPTKAAPTIRPPEIRGPRSVVPLRIGDTVQHVEVRGGGEAAVSAAFAAADRPAAPSYESTYVPPELPDLEALAARCEHAAKAARFAALTPPSERTLVWRGQADEFIHRALALGNSRGPWSLDADESFDAARLNRLAACFDNVARAARVIALSRKDVEGTRLVETRSLEEREIILLLAEAQSALRIAGEPFGQTRDEDQYTAFRWLRLVTEHERIYLDRFMRMDDPGNPDKHAELTQRIVEAEQLVTKRKESRTEHKTKRSKVRYHAKRLLSDPENGEPGDWQSLTSAIQHLLARGESPASMNSLIADVRQSSKWDAAPADLVLALSAAPADDEEEPAGREYGPNVQRVREWLRDSRVVIIGGERRADASERITDAFALGELEWIGLVEHSSSLPLRSEIVRADTRLVLVLVKLAGHAHVDDARRWSKEAGKPCVLLRAGYNPEQIAASVIDQVSESIVNSRAAS